MKKENIALCTLLLGTFPVYGQHQQSEKLERPNILWLTCEDISPTLSFYGDSTAHTPNLDKLARESLVFTRMFAAAGVCAPSRSAIITGMYPASIGTHNMRTGHDVMAWGNRTYDQKAKARDVAGEPVRLYSAVVPEFVKCFTEHLRAEGYYCTNNVKTDYQFAAPLTAWDDNSSKASWENCPQGKPFFSVFNHEVTHESKMWVNKTLPLTVLPASVPLPDYYPENSIVRQDVARNYSNIELLDKEIGEKIADLKKAGLYDKTIIFFFSDHGGPLPRGKREVYDSGLSVPFLVHFPGGKHAGRVDDLVSFVDLAPTILSLAGIKPPDYLQGQAFLGKYKAVMPRRYIFGSSDRFDEHSDRIRVVRDNRYLFVKNFYPQLPAYKDVSYRKSMDMMKELLRLREGHQLSGPTAYWFRPTKSSEEFYDCLTDPLNLDNKIEQLPYADKINELRDALNQHIHHIQDKADIPEAQMIEQMWPGDVQPQTDPPTITNMGETIKINCNTPGASIGFILSNEVLNPDLNSEWQLYQNPIKTGGMKYLYVISNRIGYADSEIVINELRTK